MKLSALACIVLCGVLCAIGVTCAIFGWTERQIAETEDQSAQRIQAIERRIAFKQGVTMIYTCWTDVAMGRGRFICDVASKDYEEARKWYDSNIDQVQARQLQEQDERTAAGAVKGKVKREE